MYQQNPYQQQQQQQVHLQEQDLANLVLSELKRSAGEYTTAVTEAVNPQIKQTFQTLLSKTLQCHATLFQEIQKLGYYEVQPADQQQLQQELQKQSQTAAQLQSFVQQNLSHSPTMSYQQQEPTGITQQYSQSQYQQTQSQQQNQIAGLHQAAIQPMINTTQYPNAVHNNQGQGYGSTNQHQSSYTSGQGQPNTQDHQGYGQTSYGYSQGYAASSGYGASDNAGMTGKAANPSIASRQSSNVTGESSYMNKQHEGSKYSF
ncbi:spore coat protein [Paenibacillus aceris]|uniref:Spore coat protein CotF n=1 Tax=Paenibacillus aceris TaxID=869555 RepID=A0ABS4I4V2_9BACL|nr:spore coat protein [Paenibacillus aceris]MBP1965858.1 spore coat protein CotF [Paenibacillus aceris]NHW34797.1 spore coat protein [Paenibacillus aceris]